MEKPPLRREFFATARGNRATATGWALAETAGIRSQLRRLLGSEPPARMMLECTANGTDAATRTGLELLLALFAPCRRPLVRTGVLLFEGTVAGFVLAITICAAIRPAFEVGAAPTGPEATVKITLVPV